MEIYNNPDPTTYYPETPYNNMSKDFYDRTIRLFKKEAIKAHVWKDITVKTIEVSHERSGYGTGEDNKFAYTKTHFLYKGNVVLVCTWFKPQKDYPEYGEVRTGNWRYFIQYREENPFRKIWILNDSHPNHIRERKNPPPKSKVIDCEAVYFKATNNWDSGRLYVNITGANLPQKASGGWVADMFGESSKGKITKKRVLFIEGEEPRLINSTICDVIFI